MRAVLLLLVFALHNVSAETLVGRVVAVADGDTLTILDTAKKQHRIRLNGIDAPEGKQPYGTASKKSLSDLTFGKTVSVEYRKTDRYGRLVGKIVVDGRDVCLEQIQRGMAWYFKRYEADVALYDRPMYMEAEERARNERAGLWSDARPVPPWNWRRE